MTISERILNTIKEIAKEDKKDEDLVTWNEIAIKQAEQLNCLFDLHVVSQQRELLHKLLQNLTDNDELITDTTHEKIIQRLYICLCNCG